MHCPAGFCCDALLVLLVWCRWEVEVTAPSSSYTSMVMGGRGHKLQPLFSLVFRRSSVQHPLLAGALSEWHKFIPSFCKAVVSNRHAAHALYVCTPCRAAVANLSSCSRPGAIGQPPSLHSGWAAATEVREVMYCGCRRSTAADEWRPHAPNPTSSSFQ